MYSIFVIADKEEVQGDINLVQEIVECYTDSPDSFVVNCANMKIGQEKRYANHIDDLVIIKRVA
jgi:hypothetical protein